MVVRREKVPSMTETLVAAGRVVTDLITAAILRHTLVRICQSINTASSRRVYTVVMHTATLRDNSLAEGPRDDPCQLSEK